MSTRGDAILVTGYPSPVARAVCAEVLAQDPRARVVAVVRSKFAREARAARELLPPDGRKRLRFLEGDAAAIDLGLSGGEWRALGKEVTHIHHAAQVTYLGADRATAEKVNVGSALEILQLARSCARLESLVFHSTAQVAGDRHGLVLERELEAGQSFRSVVEETRARAEKVIRAAMPELPIAIMRPATIVGDSRTGEVDRFDGPYLVILLVVNSPPDLPLPLLGRGSEPLHVVPIDWAARAAVAIGRQPGAHGKTFHLVDPTPLPARRAFELVARAGGRRGPRGSIPTNLARALLRTPGLDRIAKSPRAFLEALTTPVTYDSRNADAILAEIGVAPCPPFESYVDRLVEYVQDRVRKRRVPKPRESQVEVDDPLG